MTEMDNTSNQTDGHSHIADRDLRQRDIAAPEKLANTAAAVVGVGAIGRQVSLQLASIGVGKLILIDHDAVGPENLAAQGFFEEDLGRAKVDAVADTCKMLNSEIEIHTYMSSFKRRQLIEHPATVVFACVDSMEARKFIWNTCRSKCQLFVDGRMAAELCRVFTVREISDGEYYDSTLFPDSEAHQGSCTAKTTLYCANVAAGFMVAQLTKMYRNIRHDRDVLINILTNEMRYAAHQHQVATED